MSVNGRQCWPQAGHSFFTDVYKRQVDCRFCEGEQIIDQFRQAEILLGKAYSPALDPGHIQHFIDQSQQLSLIHI